MWQNPTPWKEIIKSLAKPLDNSYLNYKKGSKTHLKIHTRIIQMSQTLLHNSYTINKSVAKPFDNSYKINLNDAKKHV